MSWFSSHYTERFAQDTLGFIRDHYITAAPCLDRSRAGGIQAGNASFDLQREKVASDDLQTHRITTYRVASLNPLTARARSRKNRTEYLEGYWVPQGGSVQIPVQPGARVYVFTPDFSGCHIWVDQVDAHWYRVYHVQGSEHIRAEYQNNNHGLGVAGSMVFEDYGVAGLVRAFAFLKYQEHRWWIYNQSQNGAAVGYLRGNLYCAQGPQTIWRSGRLPVADLTREPTPRNTLAAIARHNIPVQPVVPPPQPNVAAPRGQNRPPAPRPARLSVIR